MKNFDYNAPNSLRQAISMLTEKNGMAKILAGGTDLIVQLRGNRFQAEHVIDVKNIPELDELSYGSKKGLTIGAAVPCYRIYNDDNCVNRYPGLIDSAAIIGGIQIQGRASFGGNVCNSSPSADTIPILIAYGANCEIAGPNGKRRVPIEDFCTGPGQNILQPGELLVSIRIPTIKNASGAHYLRFIPRNEMDIAVVGAGAYVELGNRKKTFKKVRIGLAAVAPTPLFAREASESIIGRTVHEDTIEAAAEAAKGSATPISDMRGTAEYRTHLIGVMTKRALQGAIKRARGEFVPNAVQES